MIPKMILVVIFAVPASVLSDQQEMISQIRAVYGDEVQLREYPFRNPDRLPLRPNGTADDPALLKCDSAAMENGCQGWFNVEGGPMGDFLIGKGKFKQSAWDSYVGKVSQIPENETFLIIHAARKNNSANDYALLMSVNITCSLEGAKFFVEYYRTSNLETRICFLTPEQMDTKDSRVDTKSNTKPNEKCSGVLAELDKDTGGKGYHLIQVTLNNISAPPRNPPFKVALMVQSDVINSNIIDENLFILKSIRMEHPNCPPTTTSTTTTTTTSTSTTTTTTSTSTTTTPLNFTFCEYACNFTRSEDKCTQMWMEKAKMVENGWKWGEPVLGNPNTGLSFPSDTENGGFIYTNTSKISTLTLPWLYLPKGVNMSCQVYFDTHGAVATMGDQDGVERSFKYVDATDYHKWRSCQEKFVGKASPSDVKQFHFTADNVQASGQQINVPYLAIDTVKFVDEQNNDVCQDQCSGCKNKRLRANLAG